MSKDKTAGCFLGLVIGDALGGPVEFLREDEIRKIYGGPIKEMVGGGWLNLEPGEYTDDSEMAIIIAESLIEKGTWDPADVASRFVAWYNSNPKDIGSTTSKALSLIKYGVPWNKAGQSEQNSAGNGSLMRSAPVAIWGHKMSAEELIRISHECSKITHADHRCLESCAALNLSISFILRKETDKEKLLQKILDYIQNREVIKILHRAQEKDVKPQTSGFVLHTLEVAFHSFLYTSSFEEAVVQAVNLGGDADTQGAVTGALAGAYYGLSQIPERWLSKLNQLERLKKLANKLGGCDAIR